MCFVSCAVKIGRSRDIHSAFYTEIDDVHMQDMNAPHDTGKAHKIRVKK